MRRPHLLAPMLVLLLALPATAQEYRLDLAAGYQWLDIDGNEDVYRTQIDEDEGFVLRSLTLSLRPEGASFYDRVHLSAADLGAAGQGRLRFEIGRSGLYNLRVSYLHSEHFSAHPLIANPFPGDGGAVSLHAFDRTIERTELDLELLPGRSVTPIVGWSRTKTHGPGLTTFSAGGDEFLLRQEVDETVDLFRLGATFRFGTFTGTLVQGYRSWESTDRANLEAGSGAGLFGRTVFDRDVSLEQFSRSSEFEDDSPITTAHVRGTLGDRVRLTASFVNADLESEGVERTSLSGTLVSFPIGRFFEGLDETARVRAENETWRGLLRVEGDLGAGVVLSAGYRARHRETEGRLDSTGMFTGTTSFFGAELGDLENLLTAITEVERDERLAEIRVDVTSLAPVRLWAGFVRADIETEVTPDEAEISVPFGQGGRFERTEDRIEAGVAFSQGGFTIAAEYETDDADDPVFRTDWLDRERWRARLGWQGGWLRLSASAQRTEAENPNDPINLDLAIDHADLEVELTPLPELSVRASYGIFETDSRTTYVRPEDLVLVDSVFLEDGDLAEAAVFWRPGRFMLDLGASRFDNEGSLAMRLDRAWLRLGYELPSGVGAAVEAVTHDYEESSLALASYESQRIGVFITWHTDGRTGLPASSWWGTPAR